MALTEKPWKQTTDINIKEIREELALLDQVALLEGHRYAACLDTYEAASNQRELILGWFTDHVIPQVTTESASFLSVGCGPGDLDEKILAAGKKHATTVSYVGLDPDPRQCERFVSRMLVDNDLDIRIEAANICFEEFTEQRRFDLVLMVHSIYYMRDPKLAIEHARNLVSERGRLIVLIALNDTLNELSSSFWEMENSGSTWFSEDLSSHLEKHDIAFERKRIEGTLDITACCEPHSEQGTRIVDFLAQAPTGELPLRLRKMIFSYIEATSYRDGDRRWLPHHVDAFIIS